MPTSIDGGDSRPPHYLRMCVHTPPGPSSPSNPPFYPQKKKAPCRSDQLSPGSASVSDISGSIKNYGY